MVTVNRFNQHERILLKGAPKVVLERCSHYFLDGKIVRFTAKKKAEILQENRVFAEKGFRIIDRGYIVGPYALIMKYCSLNGIPAIGLLAESFLHYPDPEAAASALLNLNKLLGLDIDVSKLKERGEEIRLAARDMMKRTRMEMARMRKSQEYDVPPLLV